MLQQRRKLALQVALELLVELCSFLGEVAQYGDHHQQYLRFDGLAFRRGESVEGKFEEFVESAMLATAKCVH